MSKQREKIKVIHFGYVCDLSEKRKYLSPYKKLVTFVERAFYHLKVIPLIRKMDAAMQKWPNIDLIFFLI